MNKFIASGCLLLSVLTLSCTSGIREKGEIGKTASVEQSAFSQEHRVLVCGDGRDDCRGN